MVQISIQNPLFRDPVSVAAASRIDLRGTAVSVEGRRIATEVPTLEPPRPVRFTVGEAVRRPGQSSVPNIQSANLAQVSIGSDRLTELKFGIEQLDSAVLPPVERSPVHARIQTVDPKIVGSEANDTGQTPVRLELSYPSDLIGRDALKATFGLDSGAGLGLASFPETAIGRRFDLFA